MSFEENDDNLGSVFIQLQHVQDVLKKASDADRKAAAAAVSIMLEKQMQK